MRELAICMYCDTVHERVELPARRAARCVNCHRPLYHSNTDLGAMLAVTITATVAFVIANLFPLITLTSGGFQTEATLWHAISASYVQDLPVVAVSLAVTLIVAPGRPFRGLICVSELPTSLVTYSVFRSQEGTMCWGSAPTAKRRTTL